MLAVMAEEIEDSVLMLRFRDGDAAAFETLYSRHKGPLFRYFIRHGTSHDDASELFQEVWAKIIPAKDRYRPTAKFTTYLYRIAHHCLVDHLRRESRKFTGKAVATEPDDLAADARQEPQAQTAERQTLQRFADAIHALPPEQRDAFILREEGGMKLAEIAAVTGVSRETVKSRLRYAVSKLRDILGNEEHHS
jgi:RNA polymerase sigma-70 factor (ECF subfamily)